MSAINTRTRSARGPLDVPANCPSLLFAPVAVTPSQIVSIAREFLGLSFSLGAAVVWGHKNGRPQGACDCIGLWLLILQRAGLIAPDFDLSFPFGLWRHSRAEVLFEMQRLNFRAVPRAQMAAGDLIWIRSGEERHAAIFTQSEPHPQILAAMNEASGGGRVLERLMDAGDRVTSRVYRLNNYDLGAI